MKKQTDSYIELDVREDLRLKIEPFDKIMAAVNELKEDQYLILHAPFNPVPLHKVMERKGFKNKPEEIEKNHWKVIYDREDQS